MAEASSPAESRSGDWTPPDLFSVWEHPDHMIRGKAEAPVSGEYLRIGLARHDGQRITEGSYVDQRVRVVNRGLGPVDNGGEFTVEHHDSDEPDSTFHAKISYRR